MNARPLPPQQRLEAAARLLAEAEASDDDRFALPRLCAASGFEPLVAMSQRWTRRVSARVAALPATDAATVAHRRYQVLIAAPLSATYGGAARYAFDVLTAVLRDGHVLDLVGVPGLPPLEPEAVAALAAIAPGRVQVVAMDAVPLADALIALPAWSGKRIAALLAGVELTQLARRQRLPLYWLGCDHVPSALGPYVDAIERRALDDTVARLASQSRSIAVVSQGEAERFVAQSGAHRACVVTPLLAAAHRDAARGFGERAQIAFVGTAHASNAEALRWFIDRVWPSVRREWPGVELHLIGRGVEATMGAADHADPSLRVIGAVDDLGAALSRYRLGIAPVQRGGGVRVKVLDSHAAGTPVVATPLGSTGIAWSPALPLPVESADAFARAVLQFGRDEAAWTAAHRALLALAGDRRQDEALQHQVRDWLAVDAD